MRSDITRSILASARVPRQSSLFKITPPTTTLIRSLSNCALSSSRSTTCKSTLDLLGSPINKSLKHNNDNSSLYYPSRSLFFLRPYHVSIRSLDSSKQDSSLESNDSNNTKADSTTTTNDDHTHIQPQHSNPIPPNTDPKARMLIGFTCTVCNHRAHKTMSKHAYNHGVVIMQCDHCKNRHLIADHLGWFKTGGVTVEDLVKAKGETVQKLTRSFQLVKDGQLSTSTTTIASSSSILAETATISDTTATSSPKTELELALEKAAKGTLEWIPNDILQEEERRMRKSQELLDLSKKQIDK
ncbi:hypothetical protein BGZ46_000575 [Entomortierella lignicola]|nr:hypothetical protein BGZ46_000575 [Entomortierella lignicola]